MRTLLHNFDRSLTNIITAWPSSLRPLFIGITSLGDPIATIGIGVAIAAVGLWLSNLRLVLSGAIIWATLGVGFLIKLFIGRARPLTEYAANLRVDTFSFPSGHASGATIAYGLLAYLAWHLLPQPFGYIAAVILGLLVIVIGVSRIYLGAHFPSDVIAGWLLGGVALGIIIFIVRPLA
jgi:undecaprenyl-diphosphatase